MAAYVYRPRHLLEVWPRGGGEARGQGIFWEQRLAQCCEAGSRRSCLIVRVRVGIYGNVYAKVGDDLVGSPAAVARLEGGEGLDLRGVSQCSVCARLQPTVGFFLNMLNAYASAAVVGCRG